MDRFRTRAFLVTAAVALLCPLLFTGAGNKSDAFLISIHEEATQDEVPKFAHPVKLGADAKQYYFKKVASFTDHDIAYYYPFISQNLGLGEASRPCPLRCSSGQQRPAVNERISRSLRNKPGLS